MRIIHIPFRYYPDPSGGTEVYVASLGVSMQRRGVNVTIAAPSETSRAYEHGGLGVRRFAISNGMGDISNLYGEGDETGAKEFGKIIAEEHPDVVHLHAFTSGVSLRLVREAKRRGIKVVFTYHTPTVSCQRGTLVRWGTEVCDGVLGRPRCCACTLHGLGVVKPLAIAVASMPIGLSALPGKIGLQGGAWTALRMPELVKLRHSAFRSLMEEVDQVVALCQWTKDLLLKNGVAAGKITVSRHGLSPANGEWNSSDSNPNSAIRNPQFPLKIAFLGRLDPTKGANILIQALRFLPNVSVELHLYGISQGQAGTVHLEELKKLAEGDSRIVFLPPVSSHRVIELLRGYDLLAVPSQWLETGPLVALEAFAAGVPVIGSNLGGIAELVQHEVNGILVETVSVEAWSHAIRRCCDDRDLLERLRQGIRPPRKMDEVANDMLKIYKRLLCNRPVEWLEDIAASSESSDQSQALR